MARVVHFEIPADNPERALDFYGKLFGWQFQKYPGPQDYWLVTTGPGNQPAGSILACGSVWCIPVHKTLP